MPRLRGANVCLSNEASYCPETRGAYGGRFGPLLICPFGPRRQINCLWNRLLPERGLGVKWWYFPQDGGSRERSRCF